MQYLSKVICLAKVAAWHDKQSNVKEATSKKVRIL